MSKTANYLEQMFSLEGKVALVTGGGRGIGQVIALGLSNAGAKIAVFSRTGADETVEMIKKAGGDAFSLLVDVTKEKEVDDGIAKILAMYGSLDVVFNNAGVCLHKETVKATIEEWRNIIDINLTGEYIVARASGRVMMEKGIKGSIINMASMSGSIVNIPQWQASYNASKAGVIHMTRSLAAEWSGTGIRVNTISPGYINTPMSSDTPEELRNAWLKMIPQHRMGEPEELMPAILYLATNAAGYTTGSDIIVDGGYSII